MGDRVRLADVASRLDPVAVADRVVERLRAGLDSYANLAGQDSLEEIRHTAGHNVEMFVRRLLDGSEPTESELARLRESARHRAGEGLSLEQMLRAYRLGARVVWSMLLDAAESDEEGLALLGSVDALLAHVDFVSSLVERTYLDTRERWVSESERHARQALSVLEDDRRLSAEELGLFESVGLPLQETYIPFAIAVPAGSVVRHAQVAAWIRGRRLGLALTEGDRVSGVAWHDIDIADMGLGESDVLAIAPTAPRGELADGRREARLLVDLTVDRGVTGLVRVDDHLPELMVAAVPRLERAAFDRVWGRLDAEGTSQFRATLVALLEHDFDRRRTSEALHVHRNTLAYRIARIEELTGLDLRSGRDLALVQLTSRFVQLHNGP